MRSIGGVWLVLLALSTFARADDLAKAKEHYRNATRSYELGAYDDAIKEYAEAYRLKDDPAILYNMAQAHRLAEHHAEALRLYRMYLIKVPDAPNRAEVASKIETLQKLIEDQKRAKTLPPDTTLPRVETPQRVEPAPAPQPAPPAPAPTTSSTPQGEAHPGRTLTIAGIAVGVVGLAALGGGIGAGVIAKQNSDDLTKLNQMMGQFSASKESAGKSAQIAEGVLLGVGGAAVVTGVALIVVGQRAKHRSLAVVPSVGATHAGAVVEGSF